MKVWVLDLDDTVACTTRDMRGDPNRLAYLTLVDGAREFLTELKVRKDMCALLTVGEWSLQMRKIIHLGLSFERVTILPPFVVPKEPDLWTERDVAEKKGTLSSFAGSFSPEVLKVMVGDRLDKDIAPAKKLGFTTVHMRLPEGKYAHMEPRDPEEVPDFTVQNFFELMELPFFDST